MRDWLVPPWLRGTGSNPYIMSFKKHNVTVIYPATSLIYGLVVAFETNLLRSILCDSHHVLYKLIPPEKIIGYYERKRSHNLTLPLQIVSLLFVILYTGKCHSCMFRFFQSINKELYSLALHSDAAASVYVFLEVITLLRLTANVTLLLWFWSIASQGTYNIGNFAVVRRYSRFEYPYDV